MEHKELRIELGHTYEEWLVMSRECLAIWDFSLNDMLDGSIEARTDITYWLVKDGDGEYRLCETSISADDGSSLTYEQFDAIDRWIANTKNDCCDGFTIEYDETLDRCYFFDHFEGKRVSIKEGLQLMLDVLSYPLSHDVTPNQAHTIAEMLVKYGLCDIMKAVSLI